MKSVLTEVRRKSSLSKLNPQHLSVASYFDQLPVEEPEVSTFEQAMESTGAKLMSRRDRIYQEAYSSGHAAGFAEGFAEGKKLGEIEAFRQTAEERSQIIESQIATFAEALDSMGEAMHRAIADWFENAEPELANIAVLIAEKLIRRELKQDPLAIVEIVKQTLQEITHASSARILVNPQDVRFLDGREQELLAAAGSIRSIEFVPDETVHAGCLIQTEGGSVDARIEVHLKNLIKELYPDD